MQPPCARLVRIMSPTILHRRYAPRRSSFKVRASFANKKNSTTRGSKGLGLGAGTVSLALRRFVPPRPSFCFVIFLEKNKAIIVFSMKLVILNYLKNKPQALGVPCTAF
jgi:hypothetical protein